MRFYLDSADVLHCSIRSDRWVGSITIKIAPDRHGNIKYLISCKSNIAIHKEYQYFTSTFCLSCPITWGIWGLWNSRLERYGMAVFSSRIYCSISPTVILPSWFRSAAPCRPLRKKYVNKPCFFSGYQLLTWSDNEAVNMVVLSFANNGC